MISPISMLSELRSQYQITNPEALRALLVRHRRELAGAVSEVKRDTIIHQHEVEMRLFLIDELLAIDEPEEPTPSRLEMLHKLAKASTILQHARRLHDEMQSLVDDLRVGHEMVDSMVRLGAVSQTMVRSGNPSFGKRLSLVRESLERLEEGVEKQWEEDSENGETNVREALDRLFVVLKQVTETSGSKEQAALLPELRELFTALTSSFGAFLSASPSEELPDEAPPVEEPTAEASPAEEAPPEASAEEPLAPAEEPPAIPAEEPLAEAPTPDAET